ncbi:hypothetical protein LINPERHAP2_LOCUS10333 [Linum perenne]
MRERVRERKGEGLESKVGEVSVVGCSPDRCCRSYQIRNVRISLDTSDGRFGSICRLMSTQGLVPHFVFFDRSLVLWLEGVLQVASSNGWTFPSPCESSSSRRTMAISFFTSSSGKMLKISETCYNGKLFYVLIPSASASDGWKHLLSVCRDWIALALAPPPPSSWSGTNQSVKPHKSFASVVRGSSLSFHGRCTESPSEGLSGIRVETDGVLDRISFLENCLVIRFCSHEKIDWPRFRRWASQNWDFPTEAPIHQLGDGLWLLPCGSKSKLEQIIAVNRRSFFGILISLDKWIPGAGCSAVLAKDRVIWFTVSGIPIHLRSSDLIRQLGMVCGDFLDFEACNSLSSVRIKIRQSGKLPEAIQIKFGNTNFEVRVTPDATPPVFCTAAPEPNSHGSGKSVLRPISPSCFGKPDSFEFGSTSSVLPTPPDVPSSSESFHRLAHQTPRRPFAPLKTVPASQMDIQGAHKDSCTPPDILSVFSPRFPQKVVGLPRDDIADLWSVGVVDQQGFSPLLLLSSGLTSFRTGFVGGYYCTTEDPSLLCLYRIRDCLRGGINTTHVSSLLANFLSQPFYYGRSSGYSLRI